MKKGLLYFCTVLCLLGSFSSCKDDDKPETPPTVEDIIAEYTADKLKASVDGVDVAENAKIELAKSATSDKVTIKLFNIVPGSPVFDVLDAEFAVTTKSIYKSTLKGEVTDNAIGYIVKVEGTVDEGVLTAKITLTEIEGEDVKTESLYNLVYKGNMDVTVGGSATPSIVQRVYVAKSLKIGTTKRDTSMVKLTIQNFSFQGMPLGDIKLDTVLVQKRGEVLGFKAEKRIIKLDLIGEVTADLYGSIVGEVMKLNLDIDAAGLKVGVTFDGNTVKESKDAKMKKMTITSPGIVDQKTATSSLTLRAWEGTPAAQLLLTPAYELAEKTTVDSVVLYRKGMTSIVLTNDQVIGKQPIEFSLLRSKDDYVKYFLAAEDPNVKGSYIVYLEYVAKIATKYLFSNKWTASDDNNADGNPDYYEPTGWASSNLAAVMLKGMDFGDGNGPLYPAELPYPISQDDDCAKIITVDTRGYSTLIPAITAGSLFLGTFKIDMTNTLKSTRFGVPYDQEPLSFKGTYKYTAGPKYYKVKSIDPVTQVVTKEEIVGKTDNCSMTAVLYEVSSYDDTLDGTNFDSATSIVAFANVKDVSTSGFVNFDVQMKYTSGEKVEAGKKYKLAIICSSSEKGAAFEGAPGSTLLIKSLEILNK